MLKAVDAAPPEPVEHEPERCEDCKFSAATNALHRFCMRYPTYIKTSADHWCGEFKRREP